jgi:hypothetical protein
MRAQFIALLLPALEDISLPPSNGALSRLSRINQARPNTKIPPSGRAMEPEGGIKPKGRRCH